MKITHADIFVAVTEVALQSFAECQARLEESCFGSALVPGPYSYERSQMPRRTPQLSLAERTRIAASAWLKLAISIV
jgi:hypothetical protein